VLGAVVALLWCGSPTVSIWLDGLYNCCLYMRVSKSTPKRMQNPGSMPCPAWLPPTGADLFTSRKQVRSMSGHQCMQCRGPWALELGVEWRVDILSWASAQQARTLACSAATALTAWLCGRSSPQHRRVILVRYCQSFSLKGMDMDRRARLSLSLHVMQLVCTCSITMARRLCVCTAGSAHAGTRLHVRG